MICGRSRVTSWTTPLENWKELKRHAQHAVILPRVSVPVAGTPDQRRNQHREPSLGAGRVGRKPDPPWDQAPQSQTSCVTKFSRVKNRGKRSCSNGLNAEKRTNPRDMGTAGHYRLGGCEINHPGHLLHSQARLTHSPAITPRLSIISQSSVSHFR